MQQSFYGKENIFTWLALKNPLDPYNISTFFSAEVVC